MSFLATGMGRKTLEGFDLRNSFRGFSQSATARGKAIRDSQMMLVKYMKRITGWFGGIGEARVFGIPPLLTPAGNE